MKHYLITPWNLDNLDPEWMENRHILFEKYCLPSVLSQTNEDFKWLLVVDTRTPDSFKSILNEYPATIIDFDIEVNKWHTPTKHEKVSFRATNLEHAVANPLREHIGIPDTDYIITTRLDSDDAISIDHIMRVQQQAGYWYRMHPKTASKYNKKKKEDKFWLNSTRGLKFYNGDVYPITSLCNPHISFVESPCDIQTTYQTSHVKAGLTKYPLYQWRYGQPTWLQVIHGDNLLNRLMRFRGKTPFHTVEDRFKIGNTKS